MVTSMLMFTKVKLPLLVSDEMMNDDDDNVVPIMY
jgi:hypothetical protein